MVELIIKTAVQIIAITVFLYYVYVSFADNKIRGFVRFAAIYLIVYFLCSAFDLYVLRKLLEAFLVPVLVFFCVLYQPEIRRAFAPGVSKRRGIFKLENRQATVGNIDKIISACKQLRDAKRGVLIVFPRSASIKNIIESGTRLNAELSAELFVTVFKFDTALHDGAMIIQGSKVVAAGCYLPLSARMDLNQAFGTRHRAAIGMAEESDAICLVVSEENGAMSLAYDANMQYDITPEEIKDTLIQLFNNSEVRQNIKYNEFDS